MVPLWARFLIGTLCGSGLGLLGSVVVAIWRIGPPADWSLVWRFVQSGAAWRLCLVFWALHALVQLAARVLGALTGLLPLRGAALAGVGAALAYAGVMAARAGLSPAVVAPDAALLGAVFALTGAFGLWLERSL